MSHIGTYLSPFAGYRTVGKLDQVEGIVYIRLQLVHRAILVRILVLILTRKAAIQHGERFCPDIFAQLEIFEKAQAVRLVIIREFLM